MKVLVTGGAGFIGSAVVRHLINDTNHQVCNLDKLTYAGNLDSLKTVSESDRYCFEQVDICNASELARVFVVYQPDIVMHLAAESHVDRSIDGPSDFIETNIVGTYTLLEAVRSYWSSLPEEKRNSFRFHHISTDEVYGDLEGTDDLFTENTPYAPSSPYSASKASSDHLVRAWHRTFGLPVVLTNCSNNYGPYHFPEKLIPHMILNALAGKSLPVYGKGNQIRDWLFVEDHAEAIDLILHKGKPGETYALGGNNEQKNLDLVHHLIQQVDKKLSRPEGTSLKLIEFVTDRPGHDARYAIDPSRIRAELGWRPSVTVEEGLQRTVQWYLDNEAWWRALQTRDGVGQRLGTGPGTGQ